MIDKKDLELKLLLRESHIQQLNIRIHEIEEEKEYYKNMILEILHFLKDIPYYISEDDKNDLIDYIESR